MGYERIALDIESTCGGPDALNILSSIPVRICANKNDNTLRKDRQFV